MLEVDRALSLNPEFSTALLIKGMILMKQAKYEQAESVLQDAVLFDPNLFQGWMSLAHIAKECGRDNEALKYINKAITANEKNPAAYVVKGSILTSLDRFEGAERAYAKAIKIDPNSSMSRYKLGMVLSELGRTEEAEEQVIKAYRLNPLDRMARISLGDIYFSRDDYEQAIENYKVAIDLDLRRASLPQGRLGRCYFHAGLIREALISLRAAVRLDPRQVQSLVLLGRIFEEMGQLDDAIEQYQTAIDIDECFPEAIDALNAALNRKEQEGGS